MDLNFTPYKDGDEGKILELFNLVFGRELPLSFWRWRQFDNPAGGPWTELVWDGDKLAGHYAVSATKLSIDGIETSACLSMTTMVHADYRGQKIFERSAESIYSRLKATGVKAVYGFPNNNSHRPFIEKVAWEDICEIPMLSLDVASARKSGSIAVEIADFDSRFDRLWQRVKGQNAIWAWRNRETLAWRFSKNPTNKYRIAVVEDAGEIRGYVVTKTYLDKSLDLVDLIADDPLAIRELLNWAIAEAETAKIESANIWAPMGTATRRLAEIVGFVPSAPVTYFGGRVFADDIGVDFFDRRLWYYSMFDSDLY